MWWRRVVQRASDAFQSKTETVVDTFERRIENIRHRTCYPEKQRLYTFDKVQELEKYMVTTDALMGGQTIASFQLKEYQNFNVGCFEGNIDFQNHGEYVNGGFANFRTKPEFRRPFSEFLWYYPALQLRIKTDGRRYRLNIHSGDHTFEDVYQAELTTDPGRWQTLVLPFEDLRLVHRGQISESQMEIDREQIDGMGILLADNQNGPFRFEIQYIDSISPNLLNKSRYKRRISDTQLEMIRQRMTAEESEQHMDPTSPYENKESTSTTKTKKRIQSPKERRKQALADEDELNPFS